MADAQIIRPHTDYGNADRVRLSSLAGTDHEKIYWAIRGAAIEDPEIGANRLQIPGPRGGWVGEFQQTTQENASAATPVPVMSFMADAGHEAELLAFRAELLKHIGKPWKFPAIAARRRRDKAGPFILPIDFSGTLRPGYVSQRRLSWETTEYINEPAAMDGMWPALVGPILDMDFSVADDTLGREVLIAAARTVDQTWFGRSVLGDSNQWGFPEWLQAPFLVRDDKWENNELLSVYDAWIKQIVSQYTTAEIANAADDVADYADRLISGNRIVFDRSDFIGGYRAWNGRQMKQILHRPTPSDPFPADLRYLSSLFSLFVERSSSWRIVDVSRPAWRDAYLLPADVLTRTDVRTNRVRYEHLSGNILVPGVSSPANVGAPAPVQVTGNTYKTQFDAAATTMGVLVADFAANSRMAAETYYPTHSELTTVGLEAVKMFNVICLPDVDPTLAQIKPPRRFSSVNLSPYERFYEFFGTISEGTADNRSLQAAALDPEDKYVQLEIVNRSQLLQAPRSLYDALPVEAWLMDDGGGTTYNNFRAAGLQLNDDYAAEDPHFITQPGRTDADGHRQGRAYRPPPRLAVMDRQFGQNALPAQAATWTFEGAVAGEGGDQTVRRIAGTLRLPPNSDLQGDEIVQIGDALYEIESASRDNRRNFSVTLREVR